MEGSSTVTQATEPVAEKQFKAKNLEAERRRRSKLNDRIYALRALVPKITKMSKASAIDDAIRYIGELKSEVDELERELSQFPEEDDEKENVIQHSLLPKIDHHFPFINCQVEVLVSVAGCNKLDIKIVCENKASGFLNLLEALNTLGLEVTDINVAVFQGVIMHIFTVEGRGNLVVSKEHLREWLLQVIGASNMDQTFYTI